MRRVGGPLNASDVKHRRGATGAIAWLRKLETRLPNA